MQIRATHKARGITLIEMVVTISVTSIILGAIISSILFFYRTNTNVMEQSLHVNSARRGIELTVRDIREATYGDDGSYPIISMSPNSFSFFSDVDRDSLTERINYSLSGTNLNKGITNPSGSPLQYPAPDDEVLTVSDAVRNDEEGVPIFRYYDSNGVEITDYTQVFDVAFVTVTLIININPIRKPDEFTLRSSATLRNLKVNL